MDHEKDRKPFSFSREELQGIWLFAAISCFIVVPIIDYASDWSILSIVDKFQTLLAGILALVAAYLTIQQMRKTDEEQGRRHDDQMEMQRQLLELQARPELRTLERAISPHIWTVYHAASSMNLALATIREAGSDKSADAILDNLSDPAFNARRMLAMLSDETFIDGSKLFPGPLLKRLERLQYFAEAIREFQVRADAHAFDRNRAWLSDAQAEKYTKDLANLASLLDFLSAELDYMYAKVPDDLKL